MTGMRRRSLTAIVVVASVVGALFGAVAAPGTATATAAHGRTAAQVLSTMSLRQRVGQVFMVGTPATRASAAALAAVTHRSVGNVMLTGRSHGGTRVPARVAAALQRRATAATTRGVRLFVATDQEGGQVQVLSGSGISDLPSALRQGRWRPARLRRSAGAWAHQLHAAGINLDLAPVVDTVPSARAAATNPPIGAHDREFGFTPAVVARHGRAFTLGMDRNGVAVSIKHFPGLGRVHADPDTTTGVTDRVTRRHDPYLAPFRAAISAGAPVVMMSTAYYSRLDPRNPAAFSRFVIGTVLRGDLGFRGVVISDDLGSARQVSPWRPGRRAVRFLAAGGNLVLTVDPAALPAMYRAVLERARHDRGFRARLDASALKVLAVKQSRGLL